jgi:biotin carboxyl carrier protein
VCLVEAMKVFNEIKPDSGIKGTIKKVLVTDGQAVEYGTVLFLVG